MSYASDSTKYSASSRSDVKYPDWPAIGDVGMQLFGLAVSQSQTLMGSAVLAAKCRLEFVGMTTRLWQDAFRQQMDLTAKIAAVLTPALLNAGNQVVDQTSTQVREQARRIEDTTNTTGERGDRMREQFAGATGPQKNASVTHKEPKKANLLHNERKLTPAAHDEPKKSQLHHNELKNAPKPADDGNTAPTAPPAQSRDYDHFR
jgi:hypothetical protein